MPVWKLLVLLAPVAVSHDEFRDRRERLRRALPEAAIVLFGAAEQDFANLRSGFVQEPNFYYLTGWKEPGAALLMVNEAGNAREILFLPERNERQEKYDGRRLAPSDAGAPGLTGFASVQSIQTLEAEIRRVDARSWYALKNQHPDLRQKRTAGDLNDLTPELARLRVQKSAAEVALLQRAIDSSIEGHLAAWRRLKPGLGEYQIAATLTGTFLDQGCERNAYPPIVGAGPNGVILHYHANQRRIEAGELLLIDAGAECAGYSADLTRTLPVSGKFTPRQKQLYQIVLEAQKAAIAAVKPGVTMATLMRIVQDHLNRKGKDKNGEPLGKYFLHGLSHHVGLEVHDPGQLTELEAGMVITIEPGIYIPDEATGVRIEDMILVTATGAKVLSSGLPKEIHEIEKRLAH